MEEKHTKNQFIRTTVYLPTRLHESVKMMAVLTKSNMSTIIKIALQEKLDNLRNKEKIVK